MTIALLGAGCHEAADDGMGDDGIVDGDTSADSMMMGDGDGDPGDGDGDTTGEEVCDPPSPYMGGWDIGCCQNDVPPQNGWSPGGVHVGTIMPDWTLTDQFGEAVRMYDFCHDAVWFEYVALW